MVACIPPHHQPTITLTKLYRYRSDKIPQDKPRVQSPARRRLSCIWSKVVDWDQISLQKVWCKEWSVFKQASHSVYEVISWRLKWGNSGGNSETDCVTVVVSCRDHLNFCLLSPVLSSAAPLGLRTCQSQQGNRKQKPAVALQGSAETENIHQKDLGLAKELWSWRHLYFHISKTANPVIAAFFHLNSILTQ